MAKPNSRWLKGNRRYPREVEMMIVSKFIESPGWFRGAKVRKTNTKANS